MWSDVWEDAFHTSCENFRECTGPLNKIGAVPVVVDDEEEEEEIPVSILLSSIDVSNV